MFTRILTEHERRQIRAYLKADGQKTMNIRVIILRFRRDKQRILDDFQLLEKLQAAYERKAAK